MHRVLQPGGRLTILSDNERYVRSLAATVGALRAEGGGGEGCGGGGEGGGGGGAGAPPLLHSVALRDAARAEMVGGVHVYAGMPGPEAGHAVLAQSYFDRFWEHGQHTGRHYLVVARAA